MMKRSEVTENKWFNGEKPFDFMNCGQCLTAHGGILQARAAKGNKMIARILTYLFPPNPLKISNICSRLAIIRRRSQSSTETETWVPYFPVDKGL